MAAVSGGDFNRFAALQYKTIIRLDGFKKERVFSAWIKTSLSRVRGVGEEGCFFNRLKLWRLEKTPLSWIASRNEKSGSGALFTGDRSGGGQPQCSSHKN
ncbi:MAG: hypothetical protein MZU95_17145 [Desulfomicrobium escambiense]|nr:hypothetical protein [Desulfomicrobium escambiense]